MTSNCKNTLNLNRIIMNTKAEGPGNRFAIWLQGCDRHCKGCFAEDTWSFEPNCLYHIDELCAMIRKEKGIEGVTILGGEPFAQSEALEAFIVRIKEMNLSVVLFSGYTYQEIKSSPNPSWTRILEHIDVLIDGAYIEEQRSFDRPLIGSKNQNYIFLTDTYKEEDFKRNTIEVRISKDGKAQYNGMGDFSKIKRAFGEKK